MKRYLLSAALFIIMHAFVLLGKPPKAFAEVEDGTKIERAVIAPLLEWVAQQAGVNVPAQPQVIASRDQFNAMLGNMSRSRNGRAQAMYVPGTVLLDNLRWDPEDPTQLSLLVHELVHHVQMFDKRQWRCPAAKEAQAYELQNRWLEQHGHRPIVNAAWVERVSQCPA